MEQLLHFDIKLNDLHHHDDDTHTETTTSEEEDDKVEEQQDEDQHRPCVTVVGGPTKASTRGRPRKSIATGLGTAAILPSASSSRTSSSAVVEQQPSTRSGKRVQLSAGDGEPPQKLSSSAAGRKKNAFA